MKYKTVFLTERASVHQKALLDVAPAELDIVIPDKSKLKTALADAVYLISERQGKIDAAFLEYTPKLKLILRLGMQSHDIDLAAAKERGIAVAIWPQASVARVAEHCIMQMLALTKRLKDAQQIALSGDNFGRESKRTDENTFAYNWSKRAGIGSIFGKTIGILGFGEVGFELAKRLQTWDANLLYHKRERLPEHVETQWHLRYEPNLLQQSDILVNLLPYSPETNNYINAERLATLKSSAFLVSVGSGSIIDEQALAEALKAGKLSGAALDTYEYEPLKADNPLIALANDGHNLLLTPHVAAGTMNNLEERHEHFTNILRHINGEALLNQLA